MRDRPVWLVSSAEARHEGRSKQALYGSSQSGGGGPLYGVTASGDTVAAPPPAGAATQHFATTPLEDVDNPVSSVFRPQTDPYGSAPRASRPRVTVVVPAFEAEDTLAKAVRSVLSQTECRIEVIIVDDCSSDNTAGVARELAAKDGRVQLVALTRNGGKAAAMNHATARARGEWIALVDADDWYAPTRLQRLLDAADNAGVDMVADNQLVVDSSTREEEGPAFPWRRSAVIGLDAFLSGSNPLRGFDLGMLKPVFRTEYIRRHQVSYHMAARNGHDFYVLLCFFMAGGQALLLDEPLYYYVRSKRGMLPQGLASKSRRYRYDLMARANSHYLREFGPCLTTWQHQRLADRGRTLTAIVQLHLLRDLLRARDVLGAARVAARSPLSTWFVLLKRLMERWTEFKHFQQRKGLITKHRDMI